MWKLLSTFKDPIRRTKLHIYDADGGVRIVSDVGSDTEHGFRLNETTEAMLLEILQKRHDEVNDADSN